VLNYLSDAAGFIIVLDTKVNGSVSVISSQPMTKDEAVDLLNSVLNKNGYAVIRNGRTLTIVDKNDAKTRDIPVKSGNNPEQIPRNAEIVTQIIPIRFVEARQLVSDLTSFVSPQATVVANEAGNAIVITDTQQNIRHLTEIIRAIDNSAEAETEIRVFRLKHASPADVAASLASVFPTSGSGSGTQSPIRFGGGGGGPGGFFQRMMGGGGGGGGGNASSTSNDRVKKATQVTAVADARIQAVIVTAPKDLMEQIAVMMKELDVPSTRDQKVYVFKMNNGDPQQAAQVLQNMFQSSGTSRSSSSSQNSALMQRAQNNATSTGSAGSSSSGMGATSSGRTGGGSQF
jgi:general secretion pathway protein D